MDTESAKVASGSGSGSKSGSGGRSGSGSKSGSKSGTRSGGGSGSWDEVQPPPPPLVSLPRLTTLFASLVVALSSGTNYVYSAYAPQMGARLGISHTQLNVVALAGNIGVYSSGPIWGRIVDRRGPRILLACGFVFLLCGYSGMRFFYDRGLPDGVKTLGMGGLVALVLCSFLTGAGGNGGLTSSVNSTAKTFPDEARASTTGLVISGFGLSAFFFSTLSHLFFAGNTSSFLLVLALGTSFPMIMGFFFVRPIPLPRQEGYEVVDDIDEVEVEDEDEDEEGVGGGGGGRGGRGEEEEVVEVMQTRRHSRSHTHLLDHDFVDGPHLHYVRRGRVEEPVRPAPAHDDDGEEEEDTLVARSGSGSGVGSGSGSGSGRGSGSGHQRSMSRGTALVYDALPNVHGKKLFKSMDFWLLFSILSILSGTGLMYINNVGSMSQALYAFRNPAYDEVEAATWQATQVSTISVMNFSGRIIIGLISDFAKNKYDMPRSYSLLFVSSTFFLSQVIAVNVNYIARLWLVSAAVGLAYGSVFSLLPTVCLEWFGMPHFSENWGFLSLSPMVAGNFFSLVFGRNLDAHEHASLLSSSHTPNHYTQYTSPLSNPSNTNRKPPQCLQGKECYVDTLYLTVAATFLAILLSAVAAWRDKRKIERSVALRGVNARRGVGGDARGEEGRRLVQV